VSAGGGQGRGRSGASTGRPSRPGDRLEPVGRLESDEQARAPVRQPRPAVGVGAILAAAARAGRRHWWRILAVAVVVSVVTTVAEIVVRNFVDRTNLPVALVADVSASAVSLLGAVFLSGFLCKLVGGDEGGREAVSVRYVVRILPWGRLAGADLLVALLALIGLLMLVVPGLAIFNLFALIGPVIEMENRKIIAALGRSAQLVRHHFWTVALLVTLPVAAAGEIEAAAPEPVSVPAALETLAIRGLALAVAEAAIGLVTVKLCYRLIVLDRARAAAEGHEPGPRAGS
jgi:hypothetical protein